MCDIRYLNVTEIACYRVLENLMRVGPQEIPDRHILNITHTTPWAVINAQGVNFKI